MGAHAPRATPGNMGTQATRHSHACSCSFGIPRAITSGAAKLGRNPIWRRFECAESDRRTPRLIAVGPDTPVVIPETTVVIGGSIDRLDLDEAGTFARVTDYKSGKPPGKRQPILKGGAELQRCLYAYAVRSLVPTVKDIQARLLFPRAEGEGLYALADSKAVLANLAGFVTAAHRYIEAGNVLPGAGAQDDFNDLAFALPGGAKENYFEVKVS